MHIEEDVELLTMAAVRVATDNGERVNLADAAARFGIDLGALGAADDDEIEGRKAN